MPIGINFDTVAGTKLFISTAQPTADTAAAYAALTWIEVGQISSVGSVKGREYSLSTLSIVGDGQDREKKGNFKLPNSEFECAWAESDAGQILIEAASKNFTVPAFKVTKQDATKIRYFTAQVSKFVENNGTANDTVKGQFTLLRQTDSISV